MDKFFIITGRHREFLPERGCKMSRIGISDQRLRDRPVRIPEQALCFLHTDGFQIFADGFSVNILKSVFDRSRRSIQFPGKLPRVFFSKRFVVFLWFFCIMQFPGALSGTGKDKTPVYFLSELPRMAMAEMPVITDQAPSNRGGIGPPLCILPSKPPQASFKPPFISRAQPADHFTIAVNSARVVIIVVVRRPQPPPARSCVYSPVPYML